MDLNGVYASLCFPSFLPGFAGQRLQQLTDDPDLALGVRAGVERLGARGVGRVRARAHDPAAAPVSARPRGRRRGGPPQRRARLQGDDVLRGAAPARAARRCTPATGIRSMAACEETGTVVCLHVGSSGTSPATSPDAPSDTIGVLFFGYAMFAAVDWLYSRIPVRFPELRICLSEGGIGWVAGLLDRLEHVRKYDSMYGTWNDIAMSPADVFRRNFWVCAIDDPSAFLQRDVIGIGNILRRVRLPARRLHLAGHAGAAARAARGPVRPRDRRASRGRTRPSCSATRCPTRCSGTRMPSEARSSTVVVERRWGRSVGTHDGTRRCASAACRTREPSAGARPSRARGRELLDATRPGAAPPQTVGGLDLVPGMIPTAQSRRSCLTAEMCTPGSGRARGTGAGLGAGRQLPRSAPRRCRSTTARTLADARRRGRGPELPARCAGWLAAPGVPSNLGLRDLRGRGGVAARQRRRVRR